MHRVLAAPLGAGRMTLPVAERATQLVRRLGLCPPDFVPEVTPLTGGVASDIARVDWPGGQVCVKFALEKLRVAADWRAPVSRNAAEYAWLGFVGRTLPGAAPCLFGRDAELGGFAMELVAGRLWKTELLAGRSDGAEAPAVARALGRIHATAAAPGPDPAKFDNMALFDAIRIDPYLRFTATRHPMVADRLIDLAEGLRQAGQTLIHGDISPKNIILRDTGPVFLDAECATMGDPAFDVAFCINHLVLKGVHRPQARTALWGAVAAFWRAYEPEVHWEPAGAVEARVSALLPALMLARIDGKSPVEYLSEPDRETVRRISLPLIAEPAQRLSDVIERLEAAV